MHTQNVDSLPASQPGLGQVHCPACLNSQIIFTSRFCRFLKARLIVRRFIHHFPIFSTRLVSSNSLHYTRTRVMVEMSPVASHGVSLFRPAGAHQPCFIAFPLLALSIMRWEVLIPARSRTPKHTARHSFCSRCGNRSSRDGLPLPHLVWILYQLLSDFLQLFLELDAFGRRDQLPQFIDKLLSLRTEARH